MVVSWWIVVFVQQSLLCKASDFTNKQTSHMYVCQQALIKEIYGDIG